MISMDILANELITVFSSWVGTPSEELLEDGGTVIDYLKSHSNTLRGIDLNRLSEDMWMDAWDKFDEAVRRKGKLIGGVNDEKGTGDKSIGEFIASKCRRVYSLVAELWSRRRNS